ncbi:exodeoxyribonuclease III [Zooshikella ganghwensis]|uniref:Exodeoxyribonuclease III n=1 Tax=Zooshikella ganghwensis TaxID=202772 RepID=A0A4P9VP90_9GAMM|nr:exodeoxyribonuclease III [Zooshikella ganghwensis]RDH44317.1 exodeoxyribonuclease III [Zooshikella ganghwensis]
MRIISFNCNGIRARLHQISSLLSTYQPDVLALQEIKVADELFPTAEIENQGYQVAFYGQKGHYGVALISKAPAHQIQCGFTDSLLARLPGEAPNDERRLISASFNTPSGLSLRVINGYFPQGESRDHPSKFPNKRAFYQALQQTLQQQHQPQELLVVVGDMNVAPLDLDIGIGPDNAKRWLRTGKCCFLPEEREWLQHLMGWGLADCYRQLHPQTDNRFSWFDYRSKGFEREPKRGLRIDLILATTPLLAKLTHCHIDYDTRAMAKPSDHCPVIADFDI